MSDHKTHQMLTEEDYLDSTVFLQRTHMILLWKIVWLTHKQQRIENWGYVLETGQGNLEDLFLDYMSYAS